MSSKISADETILESARFQALWKRCAPRTTDHRSSSISRDLIECYSEPHRLYHNKRHLVFCLQQFDLAAPLIDDPDAVEMAIWFHDAILEPNADDNEERSAALFRTEAGSGFKPPLIDTISEIILATKHSENPADDNQAYMMDIDLSSLALPWDYFEQDCSDLRGESINLSERLYQIGKQRFFDALLRRPCIFYSEFFSHRFEHKARDNLLRYNLLLKSKGYG